jgi:hypothetical protein
MTPPASDFTGISLAIMSVAIRCTVSRYGTPSGTSEACARNVLSDRTEKSRIMSPALP